MFDQAFMLLGEMVCWGAGVIGANHFYFTSCGDPRSVGHYALGIIGILAAFEELVRRINPSSPSQAQPKRGNTFVANKQSEPHSDVASQLAELRALLDGGTITQQEFSDLKRKLISGGKR